MTLDPDERAALVDLAPLAMHSVAADGTILWVNRTWRAWLGYSADEAANGLRINDVLAEESRERLRAALQVLSEHGEVRDVRVQLVRKDGTRIDALLAATAVRDAAGSLVRTRAVFVDVGEGARHEARLREQLDALPDGVVLVDDHGAIRFSNARTCEMLGYAPGELIGEPLEVLVPERLRAIHAVHRAGYLAAPRLRSMGTGLELTARRKDGREIPVEITLSPSGDGVGGSAVIRDVSERKRFEAEARLLHERLVNAVESAQDAFIIFDVDDRVAVCNSAARRFFGGVEGPIVGRTFGELLEIRLQGGYTVFGDETPEAFRARRTAYHANPVGSFELRSSDERSWRITARRTPDGGVVETIWDITDDLAREDELRRARDAADAANAAKSEFLASMSHELRTPLNAVLGFAQLLLRDKRSPLTERQQGHVQHVLKGAEHLLRLIDDVLDLARIESGHMSLSPEPVAVSEVSAEVVRTLTPMAERVGARLVLRPSSKLWVRADRTRFAQILLNYGSNAIKYGRSGTRIEIGADTLASNRVRVTVTDDGPGIPAEMQAKLFQPFHRAGQETGPIEGTGIGLAISRRLAEMMDGEVGFRSAPGKGSEFWVELPVPAGSERPVAPPRGEALPANSWRADDRRREVLYVEDNPENVAFMTELLDTIGGLDLATAHTAELGVELARGRKPDVVILDINLPGMSGFEALRRLRAMPETAAIPVIALTASASPRDVKHGEEAGFDRYLTKPVQVDALIAAIEELLRGERRA